ncbi:hypothetical protein [Anabaena lutea]|uniref:Uncharacterized protein n=1 Tax=Anabaena lutea FACHB-196 TaxID=2692881 RepID=A0ABR8FME2_9NOST|nr:hypothetical protein [Anabaena lutea]MBD2570010.1 hypothetical protein [Anabaena lutea FACHB-196]
MSQELDNVKRQAEINRVKFYQKLISASPKDNSVSALEFDADTGKYKIRNTERQVFYSESITNGAIGAGDSIDLSEGSIPSIDAMPKVKKPVVKKVEEEEKYPVAILFAINNRIYVGGDRRKPILITTLPIDLNNGDVLINGFITNLGKLKTESCLKYKLKTFNSSFKDNYYLRQINKNTTDYLLNYKPNQENKVLTKRLFYTGNNTWVGMHRTAVTITDVGFTIDPDAENGINYTYSFPGTETDIDGIRTTLVAGTGNGNSSQYAINNSGELKSIFDFNLSSNSSLIEEYLTTGNISITNEEQSSLQGNSPLTDGDFLLEQTQTESSDYSDTLTTRILTSTVKYKANNILLSGLNSQIIETVNVEFESTSNISLDFDIIATNTQQDKISAPSGKASTYTFKNKNNVINLNQQTSIIWRVFEVSSNPDIEVGLLTINPIVSILRPIPLNLEVIGVINSIIDNVEPFEDTNNAILSSLINTKVKYCVYNSTLKKYILAEGTIAFFDIGFSFEEATVNADENITRPITLTLNVTKVTQLEYFYFTGLISDNNSFYSFIESISPINTIGINVFGNKIIPTNSFLNYRSNEEAIRALGGEIPPPSTRLFTWHYRFISDLFYTDYPVRGDEDNLSVGNAGYLRHPYAQSLERALERVSIIENKIYHTFIDTTKNTAYVTQWEIKSSGDVEYKKVSKVKLRKIPKAARILSQSYYE